MNENLIRNLINLYYILSLYIYVYGITINDLIIYSTGKLPIDTNDRRSKNADGPKTHNQTSRISN